MRRLAAALLALLPLTAPAAIVEVEWLWPTRWADTGLPMPLSEVRGIVLEHGACNATDTGLLTLDGTLEVAPPAVRAQFTRTPTGRACLRAYVTTHLGINSASVYVPFTIGEPPGPDARPEPPVIVQVSLVWPTEPEPTEPVVVGRLVAGAPTADNYVYRRATTAKGYVLLGRAAAGSSCDCTDSFEADWPAGTGRYCDAEGAMNLGSTSMVPNGTLFPPASWTRCD